MDGSLRMLAPAAAAKKCNKTEVSPSRRGTIRAILRWWIRFFQAPETTCSGTTFSNSPSLPPTGGHAFPRDCRMSKFPDSANGWGTNYTSHGERGTNNCKAEWSIVANPCTLASTILGLRSDLMQLHSFQWLMDISFVQEGTRIAP